MYVNLTYSLKVVPKQALQQQQAKVQNDDPAQHTASVAILKHINKFIYYIYIYHLYFLGNSFLSDKALQYYILFSKAFVILFESYD